MIYNAGQEPDPRPGFYYVSAIDGPRSFRIAGPYEDHAAALADVERVRNLACDLDGRSHFMAWGTCRAETDLGPGPLAAKEAP